jgi:hypothetical protein
MLGLVGVSTRIVLCKILILMCPMPPRRAHTIERTVVFKRVTDLNTLARNRMYRVQCRLLVNVPMSLVPTYTWDPIIHRSLRFMDKIEEPGYPAMYRFVHPPSGEEYTFFWNWPIDRIYQVANHIRFKVIPPIPNGIQYPSSVRPEVTYKVSLSGRELGTKGSFSQIY